MSEEYKEKQTKMTVMQAVMNAVVNSGQDYSVKTSTDAVLITIGVKRDEDSKIFAVVFVNGLLALGAQLFSMQTVSRGQVLEVTLFVSNK